VSAQKALKVKPLQGAVTPGKGTSHTTDYIGVNRMSSAQASTDTTTEQRIAALAKHLGCGIDEVSTSRYDDETFEACGGEYLVLTDDEADERAEREIKESLWAFRAEFIASHSTNGWSDECVKSLEKMQGELCESANPIIEALIKDMDHFISDAISADGRGHFISRYDSEENEEGEFYIYRTN